MLSISRKSGQRFFVDHCGERMAVQLKFSGGRMQVVIDAPRTFNVIREEVAEAARCSKPEGDA